MKVVNATEVTKRKRYSKNKKKAWRKNVNIKDVEEKLEEVRREERYGGPLEEREDKEILFLDVGGASAKQGVAKPLSYGIDVRPGNHEGFKPSSRKRVNKVLGSHKFLKGLGGAKTTHKAKSTKDRLNSAKKQKESRAEMVAKKKNLERIEEMRLKHMEQAANPPDLAKINDGVNLDWSKDAWEASNEDKLVEQCTKNAVEDDFVDQIVGYHRRHHGVIKVPRCRYEKPSGMPSVKVPEAGQSYNPAFEDHQVVLEKAVRQEVKRCKQERREERSINRWFPTLDQAPTQWTWLNEMSEGLPKAEAEESEDEEEDEGGEAEATTTGKKIIEKKTIKQRKKEIKRKFQTRRKELAKEKRIRESNVFKIKTYKKEIVVEDKLLKQRQSARRAYKEQRKTKPLRLGRTKFEAEDIAVSLGNELHGSLRLAKPAVSLVAERFKNLQRRNVIETRLRRKHTKAKYQKNVMKRDHKLMLAEIENKIDDMSD